VGYFCVCVRMVTHLRSVAACCSVLQRVAACCSVLQCVATCDMPHLVVWCDIRMCVCVCVCERVCVCV